MRRVLTLTLAVHWMCVFALLAVVCTVEPRDGFSAPLRLLGMDTQGVDQDGGSEAAAFFATAFLLVAVLFLLASVDLILGRRWGSSRCPDFSAAFAAAASSLTLLLLAGALQPVPSLFPTLEVMLAAAIVSYLAIRPAAHVSQPGSEAGAASVARLMAADAAHASLLPRFSGRPPGDAPGRNT